MPFEYQASIPGSLKQGELLYNVWEHQVDHPAEKPLDGHQLTTIPVVHPLVMVMNAACDLEWDYNSRFDDQPDYTPLPEPINPQVLLPHIILCDVFEEANIRDRLTNRGFIKRAQEGRDIRYHFFRPAKIQGTDEELPQFYLDFKRVFGIPTTALYGAIGSGSTGRQAILPDIYAQHLIQRFYFFQGRIGLPDE